MQMKLTNSGQSSSCGLECDDDCSEMDKQCSLLLLTAVRSIISGKRPV